MTTPRRHPHPTRRAVWWTCALLALSPIGAWVMHYSWISAGADWALASVRLPINAWAQGESRPSDAEARWAQIQLSRALSIAPESSEALALQGNLELALANRDWADERKSLDHLKRAIEAYRGAVTSLPQEPAYWAALALSLQAAKAPTQAVHEAWDRARARGPNEGSVLSILLQVALSDWPNASTVMRQWVMDTFRDANVQDREGINALAAQFGLRFTATAQP